MRTLLSTLSKNRAISGFSSSETATFVFSLKQPLFLALRKAYEEDPKALTEAMWGVSTMLDKLGLVTIEAYQLGREQVIERQQQELLDLSTPVIKLWEGIVAVPLIGTLDSERTQVVMESLLEAIVENEAVVAIIDIRRAHGRHPGCAAFAQDCRRRPADGSGMHHQRYPAADRADHRPPRCRTWRRHHQVFAGGRPAGRPQKKQPGDRQAGARGRPTLEQIPILQLGKFLLVTIQVELHDELAMTLQDDLTNKLARTGAA